MRCLRDGALAGAVAAVIGGLPSVLLTSSDDLDASVRAIRLLVPGGGRIRSPWGQRALGAATHLSLSVVFASIYACAVRRRPLLFAVVLWALNFKVIAPDAYLEEDRSLPLADHLVWGGVVEAVLRLRRSRQ